jgi:hypothetical protein
MALATVRKSDKSGELIPEGTGARVRVMFYDESRPDRRADLTDAEVEEILAFTTEVVTRPERRVKRVRI